MMALDEIKKHYTQAEQRLPQFILKEYIQYKILEIIFSSRFSKNFIFLGGTAIRIVYGNDRFSEDIDLDNKNMSEADFAELIKLISAELGKEGVETEAKNVFKGVYRCYLKFPRLLHSEKLSLLPDEKILIQIDSFPSPENIKPINRIINKADIFTEIKCYPVDIILSQKIFALLNRERAKGRDAYDIVFLSSLAEPNWQYLDEHLSIKNKKALVDKIHEKFSANALSELARDVEPFLIDPKKIIIIEKFLDWVAQKYA